MPLPSTTIVGNLVADPDLKFVSNGAAKCSFRIAAGERKLNKDTNQWEDGDTTFLSVTVWRQLAENCADRLTKGTQVIVTGKLRSRTVESAEGHKTTYFDLDAEEVGISLRRGSTSSTNTYNASSGWSETKTSNDGFPF